MIRPMPMPPYLPLYPIEDQPGIQSRYEHDLREWQREVDLTLWSNGLLVLIAAVGVIAAAIMGPQIAIDAFRVLAQ